MKYYSEKLNKMFDTEMALKVAEKDVEEQEKKAKAEAEAKAAKRKLRAAEVEAARKAMTDAQKHYRDLLEKFCDDYGSYHCSMTPKEQEELLESLVPSSALTGLTELARALRLL